MAVENALGEGGLFNTAGTCENHKPPTTKARLIRNIILGCEFLMSHITHFYTLAALSYVQGPGIAPWTPYFDNSYYVGVLMRPQGSGAAATANPVYELIQAASGDATGRGVPADGKLFATSSYTGLDGIWDGVILDYLDALKQRRNAAHLSALLGGRTPQIQNGCMVGGATHEPSSADLDLVKSTINGSYGILPFIRDHQIPLTHIVSYLYGVQTGQGADASSALETAARVYDNNGTDPDTGYGSGSGSAECAGATRVLSWGVFDETDAGGDGDNRLLKRGCYEWNGSAMEEVAPPTGMWDLLTEEIENSRYEDRDEDLEPDKDTHPLHPSSGYTIPNAANEYSWAKSPRMAGKACQVGPLARMAVLGEIDGSTGPDYFSYEIGTAKTARIVTDADDGDYVHPYLNEILRQNHDTVVAAYGDPPSSFLCGFSTMDRHRARAYEALKIAHAVTGWCDDLDGLSSGDTYAGWSAPSATDGVTYTGYAAHEAPRGALAHFVEITNGKISNYQAVVPTTWNVNPLANDEHGPIEAALHGIDVSGVQSNSHMVAVEALRVIQGFDPCIACTVH